MIREISVELQKKLRESGCPVPVIYDETTSTTTFGRERIVVERDRQSKDRFGPVRSQRPATTHVMTRVQAAKITIYAQSTKSGAMQFEHERRVDHILDQVLVAMAEIAAARKNSWTPTGGGFVDAPDLEGSERLGGAVYELTFTFDRGVEKTTWAGETAETFELVDGIIKNRTDVSLANGPEGGPVVTGCGA